MSSRNLNPSHLFCKHLRDDAYTSSSSPQRKLALCLLVSTQCPSGPLCGETVAEFKILLVSISSPSPLNGPVKPRQGWGALWDLAGQVPLLAVL